MFLHNKYTTCVFDGALPKDVYGMAEEEASKLSKCEDNFWVDRERIEDYLEALVEREVEESTGGSEPEADERLRLRGVGEYASCQIYKRVLKELLRSESGTRSDAWGGCEYWSQVYRGGRGLKFHFDKDESRVKTKGEFQFPIFSCVVYLTDGTQEQEQRQGEGFQPADECVIPKQSPTIVVDQVFEEAAEDDKAPRKSILSYPRKNRVLVFDGRLAHGVLDSMNVATRKTLLINFWREKPENLKRVSREELAEFGLLTAPKEEQQAETPKVSDVATPCRRTSMIEYTFNDSKNHKNGDDAEDDDDDVVLLDDVSKSIPKETFQAAMCVSIDHPKHVLYPIESCEGMEPCTLGAFCKED